MKKEEIKFKAKRTHDGEWIKGNLLIDNLGYPHIVASSTIEEDGHHLRIADDNPCFYDRNTVCQYINEKDVEGVDIYEGDKIEFWHDDAVYYDNENNKLVDEDEVQHSVVEKFGEFSGEFDNFGSWTIKFAMNAGYSFKVVGNIHD